MNPSSYVYISMALAVPALTHAAAPEEYAVTDITLQYDGWSDAPTKPGAMAELNALQGKFARHSRGYFTADADDPNRKTYREHTTTYVLLPAPPVIPAPQSEIEVSYSRPER